MPILIAQKVTYRKFRFKATCVYFGSERNAQFVTLEGFFYISHPDVFINNYLSTILVKSGKRILKVF